ncbi:MAG: ClpXP protease specificity-enhancing factor [Pseudomonadota bacterium]|uniref:ClpXP protease specificity-enhancing factor n=1 Tax=Polaromonas sp. TaxID=1869339 RepID=UPI00179D1817|nr:ClpXP protease specificity-enhancing factor [Polaromonas sp.]MBA3593186.1 ClpXP protease specificity-enhancing factor [Polaromonas sp.]MDQ3271352.1 ClpXP protease specificity-enhancing factor [Pseudomonadota bacterium]
MNALDATSTRPYLIRALYDWCTDNGLTPYVAVAVDETVQVPREYVKNNEIVLNICFDATSSLKLGNDFIEFKARFAGSAREIMVPIARVIAIYARENGQGMAFPLGTPVTGVSQADAVLAAPLVLTPELPAEPPTGTAGDTKVVQLVPANNTAPGREDDPEPPDPPKPQQGKRPSLKRVK